MLPHGCGQHPTPPPVSLPAQSWGWWRPVARARNWPRLQGQLSPSAPPSAPKTCPASNRRPFQGRVGRPREPSAPSTCAPVLSLWPEAAPHELHLSSVCRTPCKAQCPPRHLPEQHLSPSARTRPSTHRQLSRAHKPGPCSPGARSGRPHTHTTDRRSRHSRGEGAGRGGRPQPLQRGRRSPQRGAVSTPGC